MTIMSQYEATETSPLLGKTSSILSDPGDALNGVPPSTAETNGHRSEQAKPAEDEESHRREDRTPQYEGMPEVKKKLKYILPAIGIGVSQIRDYSSNTSLTALDLSRRCRSNHHRLLLWEDWK